MTTAVRQRSYIFLALLLTGFCYIVAFIFFIAKSSNFLERPGLEVTVAQADGKKLVFPYHDAFVPGHQSLSLLGPGWHPAEDWGVWSAGRRAWLIIPWPEKFSGRLKFELQATAFLHAERHPNQTIKVRCGRTEVTTIEFVAHEASKRIDFIVVPDDCRKRNTFAVEFYISDPVSPASLGLGQDGRSLGIALQSITVTSVSKQ